MPGSADSMMFTSPSHLHKGLSGACSGILAAAPPCTVECHFVRVASVLIFSGDRTCVAFVLATDGSANLGFMPPLRGPEWLVTPRPRRADGLRAAAARRLYRIRVVAGYSR